MKETCTSNINIETDRLILRNMTIEDISQDYVDWLNDPEVNKYLSRTNIPQTRQSCTNYVQSYKGKNNVALIGIFLKEGKYHIGNLTLSFIDWKNKTITIGISIGRKDLWKLGLAREALSGLIKYCFQELELHYIQAGVLTKNSRSVNLFMKCNFTIKEPLQEFDGHIFSVSKTDWYHQSKKGI